MCTVVDFETRKQIAKTMTVEEAIALVGDVMLDELVSTRDLCADDPQIVEACDVLLDVIRKG